MNIKASHCTKGTMENYTTTVQNSANTQHRQKDTMGKGRWEAGYAKCPVVLNCAQFFSIVPRHLPAY